LIVEDIARNSHGSPAGLLLAVFADVLHCGRRVLDAHGDLGRDLRYGAGDLDGKLLPTPDHVQVDLLPSFLKVMDKPSDRVGDNLRLVAAILLVPVRPSNHPVHTAEYDGLGDDIPEPVLVELRLGCLPCLADLFGVVEEALLCAATHDVWPAFERYLKLG